MVQIRQLFTLDLERDITLIRGFNGAGKTALQNVIIWCLTGHALRSQHMPDQIHEPMAVSWTAGRSTEDGGNEPALDLPPAVPIPTGAELQSLGEKPKVDTWAQLTFCDYNSDEVRIVRRHLTVGPRGKVGMDVDGLAELGLTDLAREVGTVMPGIAAQMRFDERTTFAQAVATLTGLRPLEDLGQRSERVVKRLRGEETTNAGREAAAKVREFHNLRRNMRDAWTQHPDLGNPVKLLGSEDMKPEEWNALLANARKHLESMKEVSERRVEAVLGRRLKDHADADTLVVQLRDASESLGTKALEGLPTIGLIRDLGAITASDMKSAQTVIRELVERAEAVAERLTRPEEAQRWQLYVKILAWHEEHHAGMPVDDCPVCGTRLADVREDPVLRRSVGDVLRLCQDVDADVAKGVQEWERDASREILEKLPESLRGFANRVSRDDLLAVYRKAYVGEVVVGPEFRWTATRTEDKRGEGLGVGCRQSSAQGNGGHRADGLARGVRRRQVSAIHP